MAKVLHGTTEADAANSCDMNNVLMIAYDFPPRGGGGVQRTAKFIKYLAECRWKSTVIAPHWEKGARDQTLEDDLPESTTVIRQGTGSPPRNRLVAASLKIPGSWRIHGILKHNFRFPDVASHWVTAAVRAAQERVLEGGIDVLYSTSPPVSPHLIAMKVKAKTGLPWVADFRDPWTGHPFYGHKLFRWRRKRDQKFECDICRTADVVIANTEHNRESLIKNHSLADEKVITIRNGYDEADFERACPSRPQNIFRVCYCGAAYQNYTPQAWAHVLQEFLRREPDAQLEWVIAGSASDWARRAISTAPLLQKVRLRGYLSHDEAVDLMRSSHLLIQSMPLGMEYCVPGKLYEYLRAGTPIAAICDVPSEISSILDKTGRGKAFDFEDMEGTLQFLDTEYRRWKNRMWTSKNDETEVIGEFDRRRLACKLANALDTVSGISKASHCADSPSWEGPGTH